MNNGQKQGDSPSLQLFIIGLEHVIRNVGIEPSISIFHREGSVGVADNIDLIRNNRKKE